ncbi:MAG: HdeD family acid-resistance protein [Pyrinomonadaceae bacterium]
MESISEKQKKSWWILLLRGMAAVAFGVLALVLPAPTILAMTLILGLWIMADGIFEIGYAFSSHRWWKILLGLLGLAVGIYAVMDPQLGTYLLILSIAVWAMVHGVVDIVEAIKLRKRLANEWVPILGGLVSILLGVTLVLFPEASVLVIIGLLGVYAVFYGGLTIVDAIRMRSTDPAFRHSTGHGHAA